MLVFGGIFLMTYPDVTERAVFVGGLNAIMMAAGQVWYTAYWNVWGGVDAFAANNEKEPEHPLINRCCGQEGWGMAAGCWTFSAIWYYVAYAALFWWCAAEGEPMPLAQSYVIAASAWHAWCAALLAATTLSQCCRGPGANCSLRTCCLQRAAPVAPTAATKYAPVVYVRIPRP